jgi:CDP-diacylglycerol--glycerol-3-phosphate 3-phosphatidyltransferase
MPSSAVVETDREDRHRKKSQQQDPLLNLQHRQKKLLTLPTILTLLRIAAIPILLFGKASFIYLFVYLHDLNFCFYHSSSFCGLVPSFFLVAFYSNEWWATATVASISIFAAITDWLDGYLARKVSV